MEKRQPAQVESALEKEWEEEKQDGSGDRSTIAWVGC